MRHAKIIAVVAHPTLVGQWVVVDETGEVLLGTTFPDKTTAEHAATGVPILNAIIGAIAKCEREIGERSHHLAQIGRASDALAVNHFLDAARNCLWTLQKSKILEA